MAKANPLAGRTGEGAPIAPAGWLWRAGNRSSDMYFYSPEGHKFRSRPQLQRFLQAMPNPPPMDSFRWKIDAQEFKDCLLPGVPPEDPEPSEGKKSKSTEVSTANKRRQVAIKNKSSQSKSKKKKLKRSQISSGQPSNISEMPVMQINGFLVKDGHTPEHG